ncbi:group 3 secretory phospholipase A2 [Sinocyclocheilus grahami]|uniref:group 3 secretory phospholipase A2 n=1 Tax=Sinocyclocheilus grahami TaxID=75366 RepID=UPI0007AD0A6A|nr:PREDICTED: group 3 secretory phospholipase A2-like [Sinocyclocheilus grahami]
MGSLLAVNLLVVVCCSNAVTIQKPAPFCLLIKSERGSSQVSFLIHSPDTTASPLFYWSKWTSEKRLEGCFMSSDGSLVTRYRSLCRQERARDNEKPMQFNFSALLEDASLCEMNMHVNFTLHKERVNPGLQMDSRAKSRHKRAWVLPGTLWCGRGTSANDYEQLGMFVHADRCCREHDHCEHIIRSFSVNFGVFNPTLFTLSHCDCDRRFKQCLLNGNDTISNMVGYSFFSVLKLRCFELIQRRQCTQYNWFGLCTMVEIAPVAVWKDSTPYNSTSLTNENGGTVDLSCNEAPIKRSHSGKQRTSKPKRIQLTKGRKTCAPVDYAKGETFQLSQKLVSRIEKQKKLQTNGHRKGRKQSLVSQRKASKEKKMITQKFRMETTLQSTHGTPKASVTHSPSTSSNTKLLSVHKATQSKHMSVTKSGARTLQNKRKRGKKKKKEKRIKSPKQ